MHIFGQSAIQVNPDVALRIGMNDVQANKLVYVMNQESSQHVPRYMCNSGSYVIYK